MPKHQKEAEKAEILLKNIQALRGKIKPIEWPKGVKPNLELYKSDFELVLDDCTRKIETALGSSTPIKLDDITSELEQGCAEFVSSVKRNANKLKQNKHLPEDDIREVSEYASQMKEAVNSIRSRNPLKWFKEEVLDPIFQCFSELSNSLAALSTKGKGLTFQEGSPGKKQVSRRGSEIESPTDEDEPDPRKQKRNY